eukprot:scaffold58992_cov32-Tisochrysis_lutea.AAC.3
MGSRGRIGPNSPGLANRVGLWRMQEHVGDNRGPAQVTYTLRGDGPKDSRWVNRAEANVRTCLRSGMGPRFSWESGTWQQLGRDGRAASRGRPEIPLGNSSAVSKRSARWPPCLRRGEVSKFPHLHGDSEWKAPAIAVKHG